MSNQSNLDNLGPRVAVEFTARQVIRLREAVSERSDRTFARLEHAERESPANPGRVEAFRESLESWDLIDRALRDSRPLVEDCSHVQTIRGVLTLLRDIESRKALIDEKMMTAPVSHHMRAIHELARDAGGMLRGLLAGESQPVREGGVR
jgi:hypothetical protein